MLFGGGLFHQFEKGMSIDSEVQLVRRPQRWDQPLDPAMTDADVTWLASRLPFSNLNPASFPKSTPLHAVLKNDCRVRRVVAGEVIVRAGDYGASAFMVLAGEVSVLVDNLPSEWLGRQPPKPLSWAEAVRRWLRRNPLAETRTADEVNADHSAAFTGETDGHAAVFLQDYGVLLAQQRTISLGPGDLFGEIAATYRQPHWATVVAACEATVVEVRWQGLRLLQRDPQFAETIENHYRDTWLIPALQAIPLLRFVPLEKLQRVAGGIALRSFGKTEWNADYRKTRKRTPQEQIASEQVVASEGQMPTDLIVVRAGFGRTSVAYGASQRTTAYLGVGQLFGLRECVHNSLRPDDAPPLPLQHSLRAVGFLDTLHIPIEWFAEEILPYIRQTELPQVSADTLNRGAPSLGMTSRSDRRSHRRDSDLPPAKHTVSLAADEIDRHLGHRIDDTGRLEFVLQHRLFNGTQAMVIDLHRCTRCDDCVRACAATHDGNPRFVREGITHDRLMFVQACMHCSDPVCMIGCPTGAIHRNEINGVIQIQEKICIGCGVCAASCPYENIRMMAIHTRDGRPYIDAEKGTPIVKATKCDLCQQSPAGPACAVACPHDALVRIDLTEPTPLQQWLSQR